MPQDTYHILTFAEHIMGQLTNAIKLLETAKDRFTMQMQHWQDEVAKVQKELVAVKYSKPVETKHAWEAQNKAFADCVGFGKIIDEFQSILKSYDTKGKDTKVKKKAHAEKLLLEAELVLAQVMKEKINDSYQDEVGAKSHGSYDGGKAQWDDVVKASAKNRYPEGATRGEDQECQG